MTRFLALLAAVAMVLAAVVVRDALDKGDDGGESKQGSTFRLVCGTELASACSALRKSEAGEDAGIEVAIEPAQVTLDRLSKGELALGEDSAWLVAGPWPEIAGAGGPTPDELPELEGSDVLARSPAVIVARTDRMEAIRSACKGTVDWACTGAHAGASWTELGGEPGWGRVKLALPSTRSGDGMVAVNQAVASRIGRADFATNDIDADPGISAWFDQLASASKTGSGANSATTLPLTRFVRVRNSLGVVGALESQAVEQLRDAADAEDISVVTPEPIATADVRLWSTKGSSEDALDRLGAAAVTEALAKTGWRVANDGVFPPRKAGRATMDTVATLAKDDGLPKPGVIHAIDSRWENR